MKYTNRLQLISTLLIATTALSVVAQSPRAFEEAAVASFEAKDYYAAFKYYGKVLEMEPNRTDITVKYADAARLYGAYHDAEQHYEVALASNLAGAEYHKALFGLAVVKKHLSKYEEALRLFERYTSRPDADPDLRQKATAEILDCEWAMEKVTNPDRHMEVEIMEPAYNTGDSELGLVTHGDVTFFAALKSVDWGDKHFPKRPLLQVFQIEKGHTKPVLAEFNQKGRHTALPAISPDGQWMIIPIGDYVSDTDIRCQLYQSRRGDDGRWGTLTLLPAIINVPDATMTQPHIAVRDDGYFDLYYVSDAPGGLGGKDIWVAQCSAQGNVSNPVNLKTLNTSEDEATPYFDSRTSILYFSSLGYQSLGGYDVYKSTWSTQKQAWGSVKHMNMPLNSGYHDLYYAPQNEDMAHLTSNRIGAAAAVEESCCYDLFRVKMLPIALEASAFEATTEAPLNEVVFSLLTDQTQAFSRYSGAKHSTDFNVKRDRIYTVLASKEGYFPDTVVVSSYDLDPGLRTLRAKLHLRPMAVDLAVEVYDDLTKEQLKGVQIRLYERSGRKQDERNTGKDSHTSNLPVSYKQSYVIIADKAGFASDTVIVTAEEMSKPGTKVIKNLFLMPATLYGLLPLTIYFDNDVPPRGPEAAIVPYDETVFGYVSRRDEFIRQFTAGMKSEAEKADATARLNHFFDDNVLGGMTKLDRLAEDLDLFLMSGYQVEIMVRGFASPLASDEYNMALTQRRIVSVLNYLRKAKGGVYHTFIQQKQLTIGVAPLGESESAPDVSDSARLRDLSIYSPEASLERRAEILEVRITRMR
jgi:tetratricopeptide (TPR) repeat protein